MTATDVIGRDKTKPRRVSQRDVAEDSLHAQKEAQIQSACTDVASEPSTFKNGFHPPSRQRRWLQGHRADDHGEACGRGRHVGSHCRATAVLCGRLCCPSPAEPPPPAGGDSGAHMGVQGHIWGSNKNIGFMQVYCNESSLILNFDRNIATSRRTAGCASMSARVFQISWWQCWISELHLRWKRIFPGQYPHLAVQVYLLGENKQTCLFNHGGTELSGHGHRKQNAQLWIFSP